MIIAALPAYNEEIAIGSVVLRAKRHVDRVIVIDDGSSDATALVAELAGAEVVRHESNMGKGVAIKTAFEVAMEKGADILVVLDSDGQHNPDEIPHVVAPIINGEADMVNGSRFLTGKNEVPKYRRVGQEVLTRATNMNGVDVTDSQNGFRAFSKDTFGIFKFRQNGLAVESEMLLEAAEAGLRVVEVPIGCRYDVANASSEHPLRHGVSVLSFIVSQLQRKHPLLYFGVPGVVLFSMGVILSFQTLYGYKQMGDFWEGKAIAAVMFTLLGTFSMFTGLILNSLSMYITREKY
jgi:glycosyltransferase involved in cell wall biosynthesis